MHAAGGGLLTSTNKRVLWHHFCFTDAASRRSNCAIDGLAILRVSLLVQGDLEWPCETNGG